MLVLAMGERDLFATPSNVGVLASFCAEVIRSRALAGCVAPLSAEPAARVRLFAFLRSLKRAGGGRTAIAIPSALVTATALCACEDAGVDQVVILQGDDDSADAIAAVTVFRALDPLPSLAIHVWIDPARKGGIHRTAAAWARAFDSGVTVEVAPAALVLIDDVDARSNGSDHAARDGAYAAPGNVACAWLRHTITVSPSGTIAPCPHHAPHEELSIDRAPADLLFAIDSFPRMLGAHPTCRGCSRRMRFTIPDWMKSNDAPTHARADADVEDGFVDAVKGRLDDVEPPAREVLIDAFVERARSVSTAAR